MTDKKLFDCECGHTWREGQSGAHHCGTGYRDKIASLNIKLERANRALLRAGFEDRGGAEWVPPIGKLPVFIEVESDEAHIATLFAATLADIRDMFPVPAPGSPLEKVWGAAMAEPREVSAYVQKQIAELNDPNMAHVTRHDADNYCKILALLGMEEDGDPVAEIAKLLQPSDTPVSWNIVSPAYAKPIKTVYTAKEAADYHPENVVPLYAAPQVAQPSDTPAMPMSDAATEIVAHLQNGIYSVDDVNLVVAILRKWYAAPQVAQQIEDEAARGDNVAVDSFAAAMKEKLAQARENGREGWQSCHPVELSRMLREHVDKGDTRDVANFCMFLWNLSAPISDTREIYVHGRRAIQQIVTPPPAIAITKLKVSAEVRYWEDATVNGEDDSDGSRIPGRNGDLWEPIIDINTGKILNWTAGTVANIHYKVCDAGEYWLLTEDDNVFAKWKGSYVPTAFLCIGDNGFGDYIIMKVDIEGQIIGWKTPAIDMDAWERI